MTLKLSVLVDVYAVCSELRVTRSTYYLDIRFYELPCNIFLVFLGYFPRIFRTSGSHEESGKKL